MLFIKPALLLLAVYFGTAFAALKSSSKGLHKSPEKLVQLDREWQDHVMPKANIFLGTELTGVDSKQVQQNMFKALYCHHVDGMHVNTELFGICRDFPKSGMSNPNLGLHYGFKTRRGLLSKVRNSLIPFFKSQVFQEPSKEEGLRDDVKRFHKIVSERFFKQEHSTNVPIVVLPRFAIPLIVSIGDIDRGSSVKPHLVLVSDYLDRNIKDTIYDEHPLKEVMEEVKKIGDKAVLQKFTNFVDGELTKCQGSVKVNLLSDFDNYETATAKFEKAVVGKAGEILSPQAKERVIHNVRLNQEKLEKEEKERKRKKKIERKEKEERAIEEAKKLKTEYEKKLQEADSKVAKLLEENKTLKAQLEKSQEALAKTGQLFAENQSMKAVIAERDSEIASLKDAQRETDQKTKEAEDKAARLLAENESLRRQIAENGLEVPVSQVSEPQKPAEPAHLYIILFVAFIALLLLITLIVWTGQSRRSDIV